VRAILPGFAYQLGNLAMARMGPFQAGIAEARGGDYAFILSWTIVVVALALVVVTSVGPEARAAHLKVA
jgi:SHS family lactate transporter-like MFS transporter